MAKARFTVGVFAVVQKLKDDKICFLVNVRTDQDKQRQLAGLPDEWSGVIVDLPGGGLEEEDNSPHEALLREVMEETGRTAEIIGDPTPPVVLINIEKDVRDIAFAYPLAIEGEPGGSSEARQHAWVTREDMEAETEFRFPGKLGREGRMAKMAFRCLDM